MPENNQKEQIISEFFQLINQNKVEQAIEQIFSELIQWVSQDDIIQVKQQLSGLTGFLGQFKEYEFLGTKIISQKYTVDYFFAYYERQPVLFEMTFYQVETGWRVQNFNFKTDYDDIIQGIPLSR